MTKQAHIDVLTHINKMLDNNLASIKQTLEKADGPAYTICTAHKQYYKSGYLLEALKVEIDNVQKIKEYIQEQIQ